MLLCEIQACPLLTCPGRLFRFKIGKQILVLFSPISKAHGLVFGGSKDADRAGAFSGDSRDVAVRACAVGTTRNLCIQYRRGAEANRDRGSAYADGENPMTHEIAKILLEHAGTFLERTEAIRTALSLGMPLHEIEAYLDWVDSVRRPTDERLREPDDPNG